MEFSEPTTGGGKTEAFIASLLLATAQAVGAPLAVEYEKLLQQISAGDS
jgi:hypothetical protein